VRETLSSLVVFVVALPLCLGIAIASGVPPAAGLLAGIVGGLVVGPLAGSPLQVTGPAAGLAVIVFELVQEHGLSKLGLIVIGAGLVQLAAGLLRMGQVFRAITPSVVFGMLAGIGVLIFASQFHVMVDDKPRSSGIQNLLSIPEAIGKAFSGDGNHRTAALIGLMTILILVFWDRFKPANLKLIPGPLVAVLAAAIADLALGLPINNVNVPAGLITSIRLPDLSGLRDWKLWLEAVALAFVASAETLLSAAAVDRMHNGVRTNYDRELSAQGIGNLVSGLVGGLPMTGVIVRSAANVNAGAKTRLSAILHSTWLLLIVALAPWLLGYIPTAALAAILVHTGFKLVNPENVKRLRRYGPLPVGIYFLTLITIVVEDLLTGVIVGLVASGLKLLYALTRLNIEVEELPETKELLIHPVGALTFMRLPALQKALDKVPNGYELNFCIDRLTYIDHACLELLSNWEAQEARNGKSLVVEWDDLAERSWHQGNKLVRVAPVVTDDH
jgi:MFS superfamily sulfate permease-like transporter